MIISARVSGQDRFARRLAAIMSAPQRKMVLDEGASIIAEALREPASALEGRGLEADIRIVPRGVLKQDIQIEGEGLWEYEYGSRKRAGSGAFTVAFQGVMQAARQSVLRRLREAVMRAASGMGSARNHSSGTGHDN